MSRIREREKLERSELEAVVKLMSYQMTRQRRSTSSMDRQIAFSHSGRERKKERKKGDYPDLRFLKNTEFLSWYRVRSLSIS